MTIVSPLLPVLLVDDDVEILTALSLDLRNVATVETEADPLLALEKFRAKDFAAVVSDYSMPQMNGLDFLTACASIRPECQRILLTAHTELAGLADSINKAKLNLLLTKPWQGNEIRDAIREALRANEAQRENIELRRIALTDALTGISNHRYFWERLESELSRAQRYGRTLSLVMGDVDHFKIYNDTYGHLKGDEVLRSVAQTLDRNRRVMDNVSRYGGEEFCIICPESSRDQAVDIASRHLQNVKEKCGVTLSFGVAAFPDDASSSTELVDKADKALLRAKAAGRARVFSVAD